MSSSLLAAQTGHTHLRRLIILRWSAILAQCAILLLAYRFLSPAFAWLPMLGAVGLLACLNALSWWRLTFNLPVGNPELFGQLSLDVLVLTLLLYYAGGSTNPFVSLYLLPLVIAAATLPRPYTWGMAVLTLASYSTLMVWYVPLPGTSGPHEADAMAHMRGMEGMGSAMPAMRGAASPAIATQQDAFNVHVLGMWLGFVISAVVVAYFAAEMARAVRLRDAQLARVREETLRNERIVALGTQAAGAAHELGTPLSTMAVIVGEMRDERPSPPHAESLKLLDDQIRNCKRILDSLLSHAQESSDALTLEEFIANVLDEWQLLRPTASYRLHTDSLPSSPHLGGDPALRSALLNLLNNAADASPETLDIMLHWDAAHITLEICDHGPGLTPDAAARAGSAFFTTKQEGRGLGLFLANATLERLGGSVRLSNRDGGGATTRVVLPISGVAA